MTSSIAWMVANQQSVFSRRFVCQHSSGTREEIAEQIDSEVRRIVDEAYQRVWRLLSENLHKLHAVAQALIERETLNHDEFEEIFVAA